MPPYDNTPKREFICIQCETLFLAKRKAKYCTPRCQDRSRQPRVYNSEARKKNYINRKKDPEYLEKVNQQSRTRYKRLKEWLAEYKVSRGCVDCGYNKHHVALDIDHMEGKTTNIAHLTSIQAVKDEIERHKCVVRCANCHRIKSFETKSWIVIKD